MNSQLDTVMFYVRDIENIKRFYIDNFNLKVITEDDIWVLFDAGNSNIAFHKIGSSFLNQLNENHKFNTNVKLIFNIDVDIEIARKKFISKDIEMREIKTFENYNFWLCDGVDPEGNVFQLKSKK